MKYVSFDVDGTLIPSFPLVVRCFIESLAKFGIKMTSEELDKYYGPAEEGMLLKFLGPEKGEEGFKEYLARYKKYHDIYIPSLESGLKDILSALQKKKVPLLLITGRNQESLDITEAKLDIGKYFLASYSGSIKGVNKPDSFRKCMKDYCLQPSELIYVGDSLQDIESCKQVGIDLISVSYNHTCDVRLQEERNPGRVAHTCAELKTLLEKELGMSLDQ
jgi:phosphoglycolate phosphatase